MITVPGYEIREKIIESRLHRIYRGVHTATGKRVVLKTVNSSYPGPRELARLKFEFQIAEQLDIDGVTIALDLKRFENGLVLVLKDLGESIQYFLERKGYFGLSEFLPIALQVTKILAEIHKREIVHKDIKPSNLIMDPHTRKIAIIDFGIASSLTRERKDYVNSGVLEGSLSYISPEQTGRMNRSLDYRTDFYSLGVTFYEMLVGRLPFVTSDPLEMVHCHIAKQPDPPHHVRPELPEMMSRIIMKLMAKTAEGRYASALGVHADLERCVQALEETGRIEAFPIGSADISEKFHIPDKLVGREKELKTLLSSFEKSANGSCELLMVSGYSGVGKSSLVAEIHKPVIAQRGFFVLGKYDQYSLDIPFSGFIQGFQALVRQILTEKEEVVKKWRDSLLDALGDLGQIVIDVIPEVEHVIGPQQPVIPMSGLEAQVRFYSVFEQFIGVFTSMDHPLVFFLDDLQWADMASLKFIQMLVTKKNIHHLFIVGAFRDNEVSPSHPLVLMLDNVKQTKVYASIHLEPLDEECTHELISEALRRDPEDTVEITGFLYRITQGNPFFLDQLLYNLYETRLLNFNYQLKGWDWDLSQIQRRQMVSEDVVSLMTRKINNLPPQTQNLLQLGSYLGNRFDLKTLAKIAESEPFSTARALRPAVAEGLLVPLDDAYRFYQVGIFERDEDEPGINPDQIVYKFLHDRVHEAAFSQVESDRGQRLHLHIGRYLLEHTSPEERQERLFELVNHLNQAGDLVISDEERLQQAQLNLEAGRRALVSTAHHTAFRYFETGIALIREEDWETHYDMAFPMHRNRLYCLYLLGKKDETEVVFAQTLARGRSRRDKGDLYEIMIDAYMTFHRFKKGVEIGMQALRMYGFHLPEDPAHFSQALEAEYQVLEDLIGDRDIDSLLESKDLEDEDISHAQALFLQTWGAAYFAPGYFDLGTLAAFKIAELALRHGHGEYASFGYMIYGMSLIGMKNDIARGYPLGALAYKLQQRFKNIYLVTRINNLLGHMVNHYRNHIRTNIPLYEESYRCALQTGDMWWGVWAAVLLVHVRFFKGDPLPDVIEAADKYLDYCESSGNTLMWQLLLFDKHMALFLAGDQGSLRSFSSDDYNEETMLASMASIPFSFGIFWHAMYKAFSYFIFDDFERALEFTQKAEANKLSAPGIMLYADQHFYNTLILCACYEKKDAETQAAFRDQIQANMKNMEVWAKHGPTNYEHKYLLMQAEWTRLNGDPLVAMRLYDQAITSAQENEYLQNEAIANELAARFYQGLGHRRLAGVYLLEAHYLFTRWGAKLKAGILSNRIESAPIRQHNPTLSLQRSSSSSTHISTSAMSDLDLESVLRASQAISGEILQADLLKRLIRVVMENAGAQRGLLLFPIKGRWCVVAKGSLEGCQVISEHPIYLNDCDALALSVVQFVIRTQENVVLDDAGASLQYAKDPYIVAHRCKSMLCTPILNHGKLSAILYLENNLVTAAFTRERLSVLKMLSAQAAISIENAGLYASLEEYNLSLEEKVRDRTEALNARNTELEALEDIVKTVNKEQELGKVLQILLAQCMRLVPNAEKGAIYCWDAKLRVYRLNVLEKYSEENLRGLTLEPEEIAARYFQQADEISRDVFLIRGREGLWRPKKLTHLEPPACMLAMAIRNDEFLEALLVLDNFTRQDSFNTTDVARLDRLREHAVSAVSKAQTLNQLTRMNGEIQNSLKYAQRIQSTILPLDVEVQRALPQNFVIFKPRDLVSGDFYWIYESQDHVFLALIDCTGHGVPGAFMSMVGSTLLNKIVSEEGEFGPAAILERLDLEMTQALKQQMDAIVLRDSMEMALCRVDFNSGAVTFAGARLPLFHVCCAQEKPQLNWIKGSRRSIGGHRRKIIKPFREKRVVMAKGDMLYLASDGFADQNSQSGAKLGSRAFRELLRNLARSDLKAQKKELLRTLKQHQGDELQRDDITVIGVRM